VTKYVRPAKVDDRAVFAGYNLNGVANTLWVICHAVHDTSAQRKRGALRLPLNGCDWID